MDYEQESFQIPSVNTPPVTVLSPDGDYLFASALPQPDRPPSPAVPTPHPTTTASLLRTTRINLESSTYSRTKIGCDTDYFSSRIPHPSSQVTRAISPSDNHSNLIVLSPSLSSGGGSFYSSDTGHSLHSLGSSGYLTPPNFQADEEKKPYKARRTSSDSLSMIRRPGRSNTLPRDKNKRRRRRNPRKRRLHHRSSIGHREPRHGRQLGCHVAPTAPKGTKELCRGRVGKYKPHASVRGNTDTFGRMLPRLSSDPAPPLISRRWSSVEIGSHQIHLSSTLLPKSIVMTSGDPYSSDTEQRSRPNVKLPFRSLTYTRGAIDYDIVRTVREKLILHRVTPSHSQVPATILLRRASGASAVPGTSASLDSRISTNGDFTQSTEPGPYPLQNAECEGDTAYLITSAEIDFVTKLIEQFLRNNYQALNRGSAHPPATLPALRVPYPTSNNESVGLKKTSPVISNIITTQPMVSPLAHLDSSGHLRVSSPKWTNSNPGSESLSRQSTKEVIWEADVSPISPSSMGEDGELKQSSTSNSSSQASSTPRARLSKPPSLQSVRLYNTDAFYPKRARESIIEWSDQLLGAEIPTILEPSDSKSNERNLGGYPRANSGPSIRSVSSAPEIPKTSTKLKSKRPTRPVSTSPGVEDVVFFPPLPPRQTTKDWFSPLPDIDVPPKTSLASQSLDYTGFPMDAARVVLTHLPAPEPQRHPHFSVIDRLESPRPSFKIDSEIDDHDCRRKSVIKAHPQAPARTGTQATIGSSIGVSSGERRKSSTKTGFKRVSTIDHVNKGSRAGTWTRNRPPSVCPPPISASPVEINDNESSKTTSPPRNEAGGRLGRRRDDMSPPLPKMDRGGIYTRITGTVKSVLGLDECKGHCPSSHECDESLTDPHRKPSVDWIG